MGTPVEAFYDPASGTFSYLIVDPASRRAAVVDPVLEGAWRLAAELTGRGLVLDWILETHIHADHLTGADWLRRRHGGWVGIGAGVTAVGAATGFDRLLEDGERLALGTLGIEVVATPGHTPDGLSYLCGDAVFIGDTLFMPDSGSARCDFPGGSARGLWASVERLLSLPDDTRICVCHDYRDPPRWLTSVAEQRAANIHLQAGEDGFVTLRTERDRSLKPPARIAEAIPFNLAAGTGPPRPDLQGHAGA